MQSLISKDYYSLFDLPVSYLVDSDVLVERYRELQHQVHPDKFASSSDQNRRMSVQQATYVNEAYQVLSNPLTRANYLLMLRGIEVNQESTDLDPEFLMQQIALRERLADIRGSEHPHEMLEQIAQEIDSEIKTLQKSLQEKFDLDTPQSLLDARALYYEMQFMCRLRHEVDDIEEELLV